MKKGVSSLIATVLIIGFTIALGYIFFSWVSDFLKEDTSVSTCDLEIQKICLNTNVDISNATVNETGAILVNITNIGDYEIKSIRTLTYFNNGTIYSSIINFSRPLIPYYPIGFVLNYYVPYSESLPYTKIEVIPIVSLTFEEEYCETPCSNKDTWGFG